jgi:3-methyl-2-oxobutanoate hydroxymethyltransferase
MKAQRVTIHTLRQMKERGEKIAVLTAYDATLGRLLDAAGADVLLVDDSLGMVVKDNEPLQSPEDGHHCRRRTRRETRAYRR